MFRKVLLALGLLLLSCSSSFAQSTTVSGTITDAGAQTWNNGTFNFVFVPSSVNPVGPYTWTGGAIPANIGGSLSGTGTYSVSIPSNTAISPIQTTWTATFCPQASSGCFTISNVTITGATQTLNATPPAILINLQSTQPPVLAYTDSEVTGAALGSTYFNLVSTATKTCTAISGNSCTTWVVPGGTANNLAGPGTITGSFSGTHTESGAVTFSNASSTFAGNAATATSATTATNLTGPGAITGTFSGNPTLSGNPTVSGSLIANGNGAAGNVAIKYASGDAVRYVSTAGNDSNDGLSFGTAKATLSGAYSSLTNCTNVGFSQNGTPGTYTRPCGTIYMAEGSYTIASQIVMTSPMVRVIGAGEHPTVLTCTVNTDCIKTTIGAPDAGVGATFSSDYGFYNITFAGNNGSTQSGFNCTDCPGLTLDHVRFANFAGASGKGLRLVNVNYINERNQIHNTWFDNTTCGLSLEGTGGINQNSYGHEFFTQLQWTLNNGQTAWCQSGNAAVYGSFVQGIINTNGPGTNTYTSVSISGTAALRGAFLVTIDNAGTGTISTSGTTNNNFQVWGWNPANGPNFTSNDVGIYSNVSSAQYLNSLVFQLNGASKWSWALDGSNNFTAVDASNVKTTFALVPNGGMYLVEGSCPSSSASNDFLCADSTLHQFKIANNGGAYGPVAASPNLLMSFTSPTIAAAGCGGSAASISAPNGTASFNIFTGTAPTSGGCTITMPAATTDWHCEANHVSAISTTNFIIQQTGALSTTSVTLQLFSDVAAATAPTASDTWRVTCTAN